jgi:hypothetical protein
MMPNRVVKSPRAGRASRQEKNQAELLIGNLEERDDSLTSALSLSGKRGIRVMIFRGAHPVTAEPAGH